MPLKYMMDDVSADPYEVDFEVGDVYADRREVIAKVDHRGRRCTFAAPRQPTVADVMEMASDILNTGRAIGRVEEARRHGRVPVYGSVP